MFYAFEHSYGADKWRGGQNIGTVHVFEEKEERDWWVQDGSAYPTESGARTRMLSNHPAVKRLKRDLRKGNAHRYIFHSASDKIERRYKQW